MGAERQEKKLSEEKYTKNDLKYREALKQTEHRENIQNYHHGKQTVTMTVKR